ncbi:ORF395 [White spot syndrome virus]|uniref:Wsv357 n=3 Tax=White spot syndrome virus TaxID=342409 RepID=Q8VAP4_WSSVS|nr:wsv357 [Shrimp white spot syndrome virus]AFX59734.1 wsv357 [White spot syndrome virus]AAL33359.1 wsv357 [Shrimp white spot syndrome virus]AAL89284.1 WSSV416 [Shrimp white spot syndrome virus]ATU83815.1 ORF395 [White spot syndrome virus]AWQ60484.1 wsv357 [Shrimp white spot syndrome virus]
MAKGMIVSNLMVLTPVKFLIMFFVSGFTRSTQFFLLMAFWGRRNSIARRGELSMSLRKKPCFLLKKHTIWSSLSSSLMMLL